MFFFFLNETNSQNNVNGFNRIEWTSSANKGEWSELYTLYKLLVDQNLYPISNNQIVSERLRMPILSLLRHTEENLCAEYRIGDDEKIYINATGEDNIFFEKSEFEKYSEDLFEAIKAGSENASFEIPSLDEFRRRTYCPKIKCFAKTLPNGVKDKSDLYIVIHDAATGQTPKIGFSIKSEVGNPPTLLNATRLTNFKYKLSKTLPDDIVDEINSLVDKRGHADVQSRVRAIIENGVSLDYITINPDRRGVYMFLENLILIDSSMPQILAHLLILSYTEGTRMLDVLTNKLTEKNPLNFPMRANRKHYEAKVKRFVTDVALGMVPSQPWESTPQASGVLVVKETGDIECYHVIYKASLDDYLYHDLKFETPSTTRHGFGKIEVDDNGDQYFTLNLQLRFIK